MNTLLNYYQAECEKRHFVPDPKQLSIVPLLQEIHDNLVDETKLRKRVYSFLRRPRCIRGFYLWGSVGAGKTFLMDCFYHYLNIKEKKRYHFHAFMHYVHQQLRRYQGEKNPLALVAKEFAAKYLVLCFDEFIVKDIADAMILARLLEALFKAGLCLVATSNIEPDALYLNGVQRYSFLPAIALLKQHTTTLHINTGLDYRMHELNHAGVFFIPDDRQAQESMLKMFELLTHHSTTDQNPIVIAERSIPIQRKSGKIIWFDFSVLCAPPRSSSDYLAIAEQYEIVFISHITYIPAEEKNRLHHFIRLIDVFYDYKIRIICSLAKQPSDLYVNDFMQAEYQRTCSRLMEMQSEKYFSTARS